MSTDNYNKTKNFFAIFNLKANILNNNTDDVEIELLSNDAFSQGAATYFGSMSALKKLEEQHLIDDFRQPSNGFVLRKAEVQVAKEIVADGRYYGDAIKLKTNLEKVNKIENNIDFDFSQ